MSNLLGDEYEIGQKIGSGSFGEVFLAKSHRNKTLYVIKSEQMPRRRLHLNHEYDCLSHLAKVSGCPNVLWYGSSGLHNYMVMDLLGPNLADLHQLCKKHFSTRTIVHIFTQFLATIRQVHAHGLIHRDLKPENICVGRWPGDCRKLYLIDFGLSKQFVTRNSSGKKIHIPMRNPNRKPRNSLTGTVRYASTNAHYGDQSRRDDLFSFGHVILYFLRGGHLPWMGIQSNSKPEKYKKILNKKKDTSLRTLCEGFASEYRVYMEYISKLKFEEKPNYEYLIGLFDTLLRRKGYSHDDRLDWERPHFIKQPWPPQSDD